MAKGKFTRYCDAFGGGVGIFFNRAIERTLKSGIKVAAMETKHDSSLAAYHWMVVPKGKGFNPGGRKLSKFQYIHGHRPVGKKGDKGSHRTEVINWVVNREMDKVIRRAVKNKIPVYAFYNATPSAEEGQDLDSPNDGNYRSNALIDEAMNNAYNEMNSKFNAQIQRGRVRKRAFGGAGFFPEG